MGLQFIQAFKMNKRQQANCITIDPIIELSNRQFKIFLSQNIKSEGGLYLAKSHLFHNALKIVEKILCNANLKCYNRFFFLL